MKTYIGKLISTKANFKIMLVSFILYNVLFAFTSCKVQHYDNCNADTELNNSIKGTAKLSNGIITINTTTVTANSIIFVFRNTPFGVPGNLSAPVAGIKDGTSFIIKSTSKKDNSTVNWVVLRNRGNQ